MSLRISIYFPNLLANGSSGIAVGMATNIPSHNIIEIIEMAKLLIDDEDIESDALMQNFNGPDLPTGGLIVSTKEEIHEIQKAGLAKDRANGKSEN